MPDWNQSIRHQIDLICDDCERELKSGRVVDIEDFLSRAKQLGIADRDLEELQSELQALVSSYSDAEKVKPTRSTVVKEVTLDVPSDVVTKVSRGSDGNQSGGSDFATMDSGGNTSTNPSSHVGQSIRYVGDYEILDEIARGGMGVVYRARQKKLGRVVALKMILSGQLASEQEVKRFYAEAEAAAGLDHPGIVPIYEVGSHENHHYFSMAMIEGPSLSEEMRDGPLSTGRAVAIVRKIAEAVQFAHDRDVVHRDLKPANVLLDTDDNPHITDFGLAKRGEGSDLTASGQVLGTPAYMPPEQARGQTEVVGTQSDVYSIGAILYAMLLGRPPHAAESAIETLRQVVDVEPPSVRSLNPSIAKDLETICQKCLMKSPAQRYSTALDVADELGRFQRGEPILARPVSRIEKAVRWSRRKPAAAALIASLGVLTLLLAIGGPFTAITQNRLRKAAETNEQRATLSAEQERSARAEADESRQELADENLRNRHALYARTISLAYGQFKQGNLTSAEDSLQSTDADLRGFEWGYLNGLCNSEKQRFIGLSDLPDAVAMTADGNHILASQGRGAVGLLVWHVDGTQPIARHDGKTLAIARDGSRAALVDPKVPSKINILEPATGAILKTIEAAGNKKHYGALGGAEHQILGVVTDDKHVRVYDTKSGLEIAAIEEKWRSRLHPIAISPTGDRIAWRRRDDNVVMIYELPSGKRLYEGPIDPTMRNFDCPVSFSPDGSELAVGGYETVEIRDATTGAVKERLAGLHRHVMSLSFSPSGTRVAVTCGDGSIRIFETQRGRKLATLTGHQIGVIYGVPAVAFDPHGEQIVSAGADNFVKLWDAYQGDDQAVNLSEVAKGYDRPSASQEVDFLTQPEHMIENVRFVDGDSKLLCASRDQSVRLFDVKTHQELRAWTDLGDNQGCVDYDAGTNSVVCGGGSLGDAYPGLIRCFGAASGEENWSSDVAIGPINRVRYFDGGQRIAVSVGSQVSARGQILVLNADDGELVWQFDEFLAALRDLAVAPDGKTIACVSNGKGISLLDAETGERTHQFGDRPYFAIDFSSDGRQIAVGGQDWSVRVFDVQTGDQLWSSRRHAGAVLGVAFASNDSRVVSVAIDGTTRIWDTTFGNEIVALSDDGAEKMTLAVTKNGSHLAVGGFNDTVLIRQMRRGGSTDEIEWVEILRDDFEQGELTEHWKTVGGQWVIQDGHAVGTLQVNPEVKVIHSAGLQSTLPVVDDVEVEYDVRINDEMLVESKVMNLAGNNAVHAMALGSAGSPFNRGERGGAILLTASGTLREIGSRRDSDFILKPGKDYRMRMRRVGDKLEMFVDDKLFRSARVPLDVPLTAVVVQGLFGAEGSVLMFDDVVIRVPAGSESKRRAVGIVSNLFADGDIKPLVIDRLHSADDKLLVGDASDLVAEDVRHEAIALAHRWDQDSDAILQVARRLVTDDELNDQQTSAVRDWLRENIQELDEQSYRTLAMLAYRFGDLGNAWEMWKESHRLHNQRAGFKHPLDAALEALFLKANPDNAKPAKDSRRRLEQLARNESFMADDTTRAWVEEVRETIELEDDEVFDALMTKVYNASFAMWIEKDIEPLRELLTEDAKAVSRRSGPQPNYETTFALADFLETQKLFANGSRHGFDLVCQAAWMVEPDDRTIRLFGDYVLQIPGGFHAFRLINTFTVQQDIPPSQWKARIHLTEARAFRIGSRSVEGVSGWAKWDQQINQLPDSTEKVDLLMIGGRHEEALALAKVRCEEDASRGDYVSLVNAAWAASKPALIRDTIKKMVPLPVGGSSPPMIDYFVAKARLRDVNELPHQVRIRVPDFYDSGPTSVLGAGDAGLALYRANNQAILAVIRGEKTDDLTKGVDEAIQTRVKAFGAELVTRRSRTIDGFAAETFTVRALGMGYAIGNGPYSTLQRFAIIDRGADTVTVLISCLEKEFSRRDSEFEVILNELRINKDEQSNE